MSGLRARIVRALIAGTVLLPAAAGVAMAHPLGNFTINHHVGVHVEPDRVLLDVVIDQAEIPTFQALMNLDEDGDGEFNDDELLEAAVDGCVEIGGALAVRVDDTALPLTLLEAGISFPPGNGGLSTMRDVCAFEAAAPGGSFDGSTSIEVVDGFEHARIGWREMTVVGSRVTIDGEGLAAASTSDRLRAYPAGLAEAPDVRAVVFTVTPGGPQGPAFDVPDADPVEPVVIGVSTSPDPSTSVEPSRSPVAPGGGAPASGGAVPGAEGPIPDVLRTLPVTPALGLLSLLTAALLGAGHALTPGHGKTIMAAYLVGARGTARHAIGLAAAVSVSHTLGILGLALVVLAAESALPPDLVMRIAPIVAALTIVGIGGWMLVTELRRVLAVRRTARPVEESHAHDHGTPMHRDRGGHAHDHEAGATITWRSLFILGLAGGLIPSTNALLILLATIAAGQPAWGVVLVVVFGFGMAGVMAGVGLAFVSARGLLERGASRAGVGRVTRLVPLGAAVVVLSVGVVLTTQALAGAQLG